MARVDAEIKRAKEEAAEYYNEKPGLPYYVTDVAS